MVLADLTPIAPTHQVVVTLLLINALTVLLLLGVIAREVWQVVQARRRGRAAARLHVRIVGLFSVIAAVPAILVAVVASITLDRGLDRLFSTRTKAVIENSLIVADAYLREHAQIDPRRHPGDGVRRRRAPSRCSIRTASASASSSPRRRTVRGLSGAMILGTDAEVIERADIKAEHDDRHAVDAPGLPSINETEPQIGIVARAPMRSPP